MSTIKIYSQNVTDEPTVINCPSGEAFYWARKFRQHVKPGLIQFTGEVPCTPYLGYVAVPEDELAAEWLVDQRLKVSKQQRL